MAGLRTFLRRLFVRSGRPAPDNTSSRPATDPPAAIVPETPPPVETTQPPPAIEPRPAPKTSKNREPLRAAAAFAAPPTQAAERNADNARALIDIVTPQALRFDLPPSLLFAIIAEVSDFVSDAQFADGALGLMQVRPGRPSAAALKLLGRSAESNAGDTLLDAATNIELGAACIHLLDTRTFKDVNDATERLTLVLNAYLTGQTGKPALDQSRAPQPDDAQTGHVLARVASFRAFDAAFDALADQ